MRDENVEELRRIAGKTYVLSGREQPYLTAQELDYLTVRKGNLTQVERAAIEQHAVVTHKMLKELPFPKRLANVPDYAAHHHEKLDGSGYPDRLKADQLPLQTRILAIADVFEALTSQDRPYKTPLKLSEAMKILAQMRDHNHIDPDLYQLFIDTRLYYKYAQRELSPEQIDTD
jgi:HD-GYP domain-containing protein (c-di-GMP phosphodiesterase class II)